MSDLNLNSAEQHYDGPVIWRTPPGLPGLYEVSTHGGWRTRMNVDRYRGRWRSYESTEWREYAPARNSGKYQYATYRDLSGRQCTKGIHELVMLTFVGPMPEGMHLVRHLDDDNSNHHLSNLCYGTHADNARDRQRNRARRQAAHHTHETVGI